MKGRFKKTTWERMAKPTCKALNNALQGNVIRSIAPEEMKRLRGSGKGWLKELRTWLAEANRKEGSQPYPHPALSREQNRGLKKRLDMMERLEKRFPGNLPSPNLVATFDAAVSSPISRYYLCNTAADFFLALIRIRAALVWEALEASEATRKGIAIKALDKGAEMLRVNNEEFPNTAFPRLQDLLNQYQIPLIAVKVEKHAFEAFFRLESGPVESRLLLHEIAGKRLSPRDVLGSSDYIDLALSGLSHLLPLELPVGLITSPYYRKKIWEVIILLLAYWGNLTGASGVSLGFCWSCGNLYWVHRRGGPPSRTCSPACKTALHRARRGNHAITPVTYQLWTGISFTKRPAAYPVHGLMNG